MVKARRVRRPFLKVKAKMVEKEITQGEMANNLGISQSTFNQKLNGVYDFKLTEIKAIATILGIHGDRINECFFEEEIL